MLILFYSKPFYTLDPELRPQDVLSFSAAISACGHQRLWRWALLLLENLGSHADVVSCNGAVDACAKALGKDLTMEMVVILGGESSILLYVLSM